MDSYTNNQTSAPRHPIHPLARYRVMARHRDQVFSTCRSADDAHLAAPSSISSIERTAPTCSP